MNSIKNSTKFDSIVKELASSLFSKKLKEITTTASIDPIMTPYAFSKKGMKKKRKNNAIALRIHSGISMIESGGAAVWYMPFCSLR